ncbi:uncharacterized protein I206_100740 [Kwoniella pini CBS 10737]|uniref:Uncharacterized protein n=1 Tax=Kwoniella pini CBS 10737 TaxID=1296096 RepID=A0A1B9ICN3_9TREE|nr:uncharacterized protein I206_00587 [Kwoniella pini CBS 10737]OCF53286.1 hypothetical protein I206_00587 [Kwoniella pini CBS 10737]
MSHYHQYESNSFQIQEEKLEDLSQGIKVTSHDYHISNIPTNETRRRASTLVNLPNSQKSSTQSSIPSDKDIPIRPPKSQFRPRFPSISTSTKIKQTDIGTERKRHNSQLSLGGLERLGGILKSFVKGLKSDFKEQQELPDSQIWIDRKKEEDHLRTRDRLTSISLSALIGQSQRTHKADPSGSIKTMSLSDQRSTQRLINRFMEELEPRSPTGNFHSYSQNPSPTTRHAHVQRIRNVGGHRRTHSSPGPTPTLSGASDIQSERGRTLSGGIFGNSIKSSTGDSHGLISDTDTSRSGRVDADGTASAPISPALTRQPLPSSPLPARPSARTPPHTPSRAPSNRGISPDTHPFAAVVAMMEAGNSPTKRRSRAQLGSKEVLSSPTKKGKERAEGERPHLLEGNQGRKQTPRRGFIGPGGLMPRIASRKSLAKLKLATSHSSSTPNPVIVSIPPSPPDTAKPQYPQTVSPLTPSSTTYLRPAPAPPLMPFWSKPRFAMSTSARNPSPAPSTISRGGTPTPLYAPRSGADGLPPGPGSELVEIPRFKKKELNLGIIRRRGLRQRVAWLCLWVAWLGNGLLSLFFDVNVIYILVQCTLHPSFTTNSEKSWQFATAAYAVLWAISTLAVWVGWELGYEFWRRWRLPRPSVETIYMSFPASLHLSLISFNHFTFLLHIRTSPLNTPYARDILPETCQALIQLIPGLLPLLPRAAIAVVALISFWSPAPDVQAPYGGAVDQTSNRDSNFFNADAPGQLTSYAKGVLLSFTAWIALRLLIVIGSGIGLWMFSGRPLGGLIGQRLSRKKKVSGPPTTPRKPKSSLQPRDPSTTSSPQKSWVDQENEFNWAWRERTRSRIQDAFELCMIRRNDGGIGRLDSFLYQSEIPWGRMMGQRSRLSNNLNTSDIELNNQDPSKVTRAISAKEFVDGFVEGKDLPSVTTTPDRSHFKSRTSELARPESLLDPTSNGLETPIRPSPSRANTAASSSATDLFYTPFEGNTPQTEKTRSVAEGIDKLPTQLQVTPHQTPVLPPSSYKTRGGLDEFGVKEKSSQTRGGSPDSANGSGDGDDESTGLLTTSTSNSARNTIIKKSRSRSSTINSTDHSSNDHSTSSPLGGNSRSSSFSSNKARKRAYTSGSLPKDSLRRTRSSSITLLRESVTNAANASGQLIRRARSGTVLSSVSTYSKMDGSDEEDDEEDKEILDHGKITPRSRRGTGLNLSMNVPFAINEKSNS